MSTSINPPLQLNGFSFTEIFTAAGLARLDRTFLAELPADLRSRLLAYRQTLPEDPLIVSELLLALSPLLEDFLARFFNIEEAVALARAKTQTHNPVSAFKEYFVLRRAKKLMTQAHTLAPFSELNAWLTDALRSAALVTDDRELAIALFARECLHQADKYTDTIEKLTHWCTQALATPEGRAAVAGWSAFQLPARIDHTHRLPCERHDNILHYNAGQWQQRDGFALTDKRMDARHVQDTVNYCIYCHDHRGDFCSKGFPVKKGQPALGFKKNPLDVTLTGCPLEEKISEMNILKRDGYTLGALAMVMIDNPMCPATGHRICNDCMLACIYQKQDPVNIPQAETRILTDVLDLPWGVEIYDLLTRWHPLRQKQWCMQAYNGKKIMIAGMGPAGFTLAHHLLLAGFAVVGFDGLKIEPLPQKYLHEPIYRYADLVEPLDNRLVSGFGGVAEYGITNRWDKNFLKLIYISLSRKPHFQIFGGARFGGTITVEDAFAMGFDHFAIAVGAGLPKALAIPGSLAPGMRQANDFLMALQLGNAARPDSLTSLQVRLPAVVIGGGLTGVDTATEIQAYYICQVENMLARYEKLAAIYGETAILAQLDHASREILNEFLTHGKAVRHERMRAKAAGKTADFITLLKAWGGVTIAYRRTLQESPAYIHNHEELHHAFAQGISYREALEPLEALRNQYGHVTHLRCQQRQKNAEGQWQTLTNEITLPARSILVATGTKPNVAYEFEHEGTFSRIGFQYQHYELADAELKVAHGVEHCKDPDFGPFTSYAKNDKRVSLIGDTHPVFHGSVVKAIASGMRTYPKIASLLANHPASTDVDYPTFAAKMQDFFTATVVSVKKFGATIIEIKIRAPLAARKARPGQFFRLQNFTTYAPNLHDTCLQIEPLALTAAQIDADEGVLTFMILAKGASSKLCQLLTPGEPVSLMGPTGVRARIATAHETVLIMGDVSSLPMIQAYGSALKAAGNRVIYAAEFKQAAELYCQAEVEAACDVAIWLTRHNEIITTHRPQDYSVANTHDSLLEILLRYAHGTLDTHKKSPEIVLADVDRIYLIGTTELLRQFQAARQLPPLKTLLAKDPVIRGSVYSTMQCMLKGVCAQCLQWQIDPETGKRTKAVFACSWPEQPLELIDFANIDERQAQNKLSEKLNALWVDYVLSTTAQQLKRPKAGDIIS